MGASTAYEHTAHWSRILLRRRPRRALGVEHAALSRAAVPAAAQRWATAFCRMRSRCLSPLAMRSGSSARRLPACSLRAESRSRSLCSMTPPPIEPRKLCAALPPAIRACAWTSAPSLPRGWNGKQHACHVLAAAGPLEYPLLSRRGCASCARSSGLHVRVSGAAPAPTW